jgi:hypothetical protein
MTQAVWEERYTGSGLQDIFLIPLKYPQLKQAFNSCTENQHGEVKSVQGSENFGVVLLLGPRLKNSRTREVQRLLR